MIPSPLPANISDKDNFLSRRIRLFSWVLMASWTLLITVSWFWVYQAERQQISSQIVHVIFLLYGLGITGVGACKLSGSARAQKLIEFEMQQQALHLEDEIAERKAAQANLEELNHTLVTRINLAVTDLRRKDQALIQQGRLAAMGEMVKNIAHQWRQPLNNIGLIIQNLQFSYNAGTLTREEMEQDVSNAMGVIMHMSRTIDDFRSFFREDKQIGSFNISETVHKALEFVSSSLSSHDILVELDDDKNVTVIGYQNEYVQVLLNILSNAYETCIERKVTTPRIHIRLADENGRSVVYIRDNCGGIAEDIMPKIFDPYFTTRAPDRGTGIGLYMSKVIIEQNMGGSLTSRNSENGAEFRIEV
ncbi:MAG: ATP-binding protein [Desulfuromonadaceae bacterium]|nr:ATP-binding protein [Desulfuromonadaceae bacterium]